MNLPKFIITLNGVFRLGMVNQHKDLLKPGDQCIGGGYYRFDDTTFLNTPQAIGVNDLNTTLSQQGTLISRSCLAYGSSVIPTLGIIPSQ